MRIVIAGGHGKIALLLERFLAERGDQAVGLIRTATIRSACHASSSRDSPFGCRTRTRPAHQPAPSDGAHATRRQWSSPTRDGNRHTRGSPHIVI